ncbi:MAG TPA: RodZ domain-containing protein [Acetobacteraceae bacterium]|nr:RodZ domain-containing protein [Acetobacteraceae bacterium]
MTDGPARPDLPQAPAARLGAELREARRQQGWDLAQLAGSLRIRQTYLEAIESGRISDLPGTTYALGFVRAYASALGLPAEDAARRFRAEAEQVHGRPALRFPAPVPRQGVPVGALTLLGAVILAGAYGGWYWVTEHRAAKVEVVPPIPDRLQPAGPKPAPSPQVATILPNTAPPAAVPPAPPTATPAPSSPTPQPAPATPPQTTAVAPPQPAPATTAPAVVPQATPVTPAGARIVVKATADAWITVKQPNGPPVLNKLLHAGDTWSVPTDKTGLLMTTGNAGGTEIDVDGAPIPGSLGTSGMVRRDVPLDADLLKSGNLPPPKPKAKPHPAAAPDDSTVN